MFGTTSPAGNEDPAIYAKKLQVVQNSADGIAEEYRKAIANRHSTENGVDLVGVVPQNISLATHTYGKDSKTTSDYVQEMNKLDQYICTTLNYPLALLGLDNSSDGLGSAKYEVAAGIAMGDAVMAQKYWAKNLITPLINQKALAERSITPKYQIEWEGGNLSDQASKANVRKTNAEATKLALEAYELANMNLPPEDREKVVEHLLEQIK
jgi:hypothetical protein